DARMLDGLRPYDNLLSEDLPTHEFANRLVPVFDVWRKLGTWEHLHPWMEVILPWSTAAEVMDMILPPLSPRVPVGGPLLPLPARLGAGGGPALSAPGRGVPGRFRHPARRAAAVLGGVQAAAAGRERAVDRDGREALSLRLHRVHAGAVAAALRAALGRLR